MLYQHLQYASDNSNIQILIHQFKLYGKNSQPMRKNASSKKYVYIATEHKSSAIRRFATKSTVRETAREKQQK